MAVPKKEKGDWRLLVDYRGLNAVTEHDAYQLPLIGDMLNKHGRRKVFTVLDMKKGYHQMPLAKVSRPMTAVTTPSLRFPLKERDHKDTSRKMWWALGR